MHVVTWRGKTNHVMHAMAKMMHFVRRDDLFTNHCRFWSSFMDDTVFLGKRFRRISAFWIGSYERRHGSRSQPMGRIINRSEGRHQEGLAQSQSQFILCILYDRRH